jgi:hypothetical protein
MDDPDSGGQARSPRTPANVGTVRLASDNRTGRFGYGASPAAIRSSILIGEDVF